MLNLKPFSFQNTTDKKNANFIYFSFITSLLNTQKYKIRIKGKVEQSREKSSTLSYTSA